MDISCRRQLDNYVRNAVVNHQYARAVAMTLLTHLEIKCEKKRHHVQKHSPSKLRLSSVLEDLLQTESESPLVFLSKLKHKVMYIQEQCKYGNVELVRRVVYSH